LLVIALCETLCVAYTQLYLPQLVATKYYEGNENTCNAKLEEKNRFQQHASTFLLTAIQTYLNGLVGDALFYG